MIDFPKWNYFVNDAEKKSYVSTSTSPGTVSCTTISGFDPATQDPDCVFIHGVFVDTLVVNFNGILAANIRSGTAISFLIDGVKAPPSTSAVTGFSFRTTSVDYSTID